MALVHLIKSGVFLDCMDPGLLWHPFTVRFDISIRVMAGKCVVCTCNNLKCI